MEVSHAARDRLRQSVGLRDALRRTAGHMDKATDHAVLKKWNHFPGMGGTGTRFGRFDARVSNVAALQISLGVISRPNRFGSSRGIDGEVDEPPLWIRAH